VLGARGWELLPLGEIARGGSHDLLPRPADHFILIHITNAIGMGHHHHALTNGVDWGSQPNVVQPVLYAGCFVSKYLLFITAFI
jgi:hypothetical protein